MFAIDTASERAIHIKQIEIEGLLSNLVLEARQCISLEILYASDMYLVLYIRFGIYCPLQYIH